MTILESPTVEVGSRSQDFRQSMQAKVSLAEAKSALTSRAGVVSSIEVSTGSEVSNGTLLMHVDGQAVSALSGGQPLYRDLQLGDEGPDVESMSGFLASRQLLLTEDIDDEIGPTISQAICAYQKEVGLQCDSIFKLEYVAYVPEGFGLVETILPSLGETVDIGDVLISGGQVPLGIEFSPSSENGSLAAYEGQAVSLTDLSGAVLELPGIVLDAQGAATVFEFLSEGVKRQSIRPTETETGDKTASSGSITYSGFTLALTHATKSATVPNTSVYVNTLGIACLFEATTASMPSTDPTEPVARSYSPIALDSFSASTSDLGQTTVPVDLVGHAVARDVSLLKESVLNLCE